MNMKLDRVSFLSFNTPEGGQKPAGQDEPEPKSRVKPKPDQPKKPMAVYYAVGISAALLQLAIIASATLLLFGSGENSASAKNPILAAAGMIIASSPNYEVAGTDFKAGKIEIKDLNSGKIASFSSDDIKNGIFKFTNSGGDVINIDSRAAEKSESSRPSEIPEGIILYPGATPKVLSYMASDESEEGSIEQITNEPISKVIETFEKALLAAGYSISSKSLYEDEGSLVSERDGSKRVIAIDAKLEEGRTKIVIQYNFTSQ